MKTIKQSYRISAPVSEVWAALTDPAVITKWGGGPAKMSETPKSEFSLWGGDIHGKNTEVMREQKLVQEWFGGDWDKPSEVTFTLTSTIKGTELNLVQVNVPEEEVRDIADGWKIYYIGPMKDLIEKAYK